MQLGGTDSPRTWGGPGCFARGAGLWDGRRRGPCLPVPALALSLLPQPTCGFSKGLLKVSELMRMDFKLFSNFYKKNLVF